MSDARERIGNHLTLDGELSRVRDVPPHTAAAQRIGKRLAPIRRRVVYLDGVGKGDAFSDPFDPRAHVLAGYRARDEHDLPVRASDHTAAGGGLLNGERDDLAGAQHLVIGSSGYLFIGIWSLSQSMTK